MLAVNAVFPDLRQGCFSWGGLAATLLFRAIAKPTAPPQRQLALARMKRYLAEPLSPRGVDAAFGVDVGRYRDRSQQIAGDSKASN